MSMNLEMLRNVKSVQIRREKSNLFSLLIIIYLPD